jgi:hypothetical protein
MNEQHAPQSRNMTLGIIGWLWVGIPFCYGLVQLVLKIPALFST